MAIEEEVPSHPGTTLPLPSAFAISVAVVIIFASFYLYRQMTDAEVHQNIVIAAGSTRGSFNEFGHLFKQLLDATGKFDQVTVMNTAGSFANLDALASGSADLALTQSNVATLADARMIADIYPQYLHILVAKELADRVDSISDLEGLRVSVGQPESGTRDLVLSILEHFQVTPGEMLPLRPGESSDALLAGEIDAAFILTALSNENVTELTDVDAVRFISLGSANDDLGGRAHALGVLMPGVEHAVIPVGVYGRLPLVPIHTVSVEALLTASPYLPELLVREITETLFSSRTQLNDLTGSALYIARSLRENYSPAEAQLPYHEGAVSYYTREEPAFFVRNADAISLVLTILAGIYSLFIAGREYVRRTLKNRVDSYLVQVDRLSSDVSRLTIPQLNSRKAALERLRREAFSDLVLEKVLADSSFIILQNHLRDEVEDLTTRIDKNADRLHRQVASRRKFRT
ncbi:MAG: TAXI family TRAP transporter solute-binding subunit [Pseudomonadota bacterium]